jgi:cell division initiation protein
MSLSPAEIRHAELRRGLFGYKRVTVDELLDETVESFEQVWRERADLADKVEQLEAEIVRYRELESLLRTTLVSAERASHELRDQARKESELIVSEAQSEARRITRDARGERERLAVESTRIKTMLRAALESIEEEPEPKPEPKSEPKPRAA